MAPQPDRPDHPGKLAVPEGVRHTGTDALPYFNQNSQQDPLNGQTIQVMTWDEGDHVVVNWDLYDDQPSNGGNPDVLVTPSVAGQLNFKTDPNTDSDGPDPDIVLAYNPADDELYANLVYISKDQIQYRIYKWDATSHNFVNYGTPQPLGDNRYTHSYPNIDANRDGFVAVTWQQTVSDNVTISVTSQSNYFAPFTIVEHITFGRAVLAGGTIIGDFKDCYKDPQSGTMGLYILNPPTGLFEQTLRPDVAISEAVNGKDDVVISSTFLRHYVDGNGLFSIVNGLDVVQTRYDLCGNFNEQNPGIKSLTVVDKYEWGNYSMGGTLGTPRIAATPLPRDYVDFNGNQRGLDVEVAVDHTVGDCFQTQYDIWNFGKSAGHFRDQYTQISPLGKPCTILSTEPAISFSWAGPNRFPNRRSAGYTISWTGGQGYDSGNSKPSDIFAVWLNDGRHFGNGSSGPTAQPAGYNRVNLLDDGDQLHPSLAGRYLIGNVVARDQGTPLPDPDDPEGATPGIAPLVHLWSNAARKEMEYRRTADFAGGGVAYRPGRNGGNAVGAGLALVQVYPNPSTDHVSVSLRLQAGETLHRLLVVDAQGRTVAELPAAPNGTAEWKPAAGTPAGLYQVRAETDRRTASQSLVRQ